MKPRSLDVSFEFHKTTLPTRMVKQMILERFEPTTPTDPKEKKVRQIRVNVIDATREKKKRG